MQKKIVFIGEGPLFNHCVKSSLKKIKKFSVITSLKNKKLLKLNKKFYINYKNLNKIKKIDFLLSIMNGRIIDQNVLDKVDYPINFHDGPLPKYGGLYSSTWAILKNENTHGCCWHLMTSKVDSGDIISSKKFRIEDTDTAYTVDLKSLIYGFEMYETYILRMIRQNSIKIKKKNNKIISYFGKKDFSKIPNKGFLNFKKSLKYNYKLFRALSLSKEKTSSLFKPKISWKNKIMTVNNFNEISVDSIKFFEKNKNITYNNNSIFVLKNNKYYQLKLKKKKDL